jgi:hypothetical protein
MDTKLFFSGFYKLYDYWETLVLISIFVVIANSLYSLVIKKNLTFFDLRIILFSLIFNYIFFVIGLFIFLSNIILIYNNPEHSIIIKQDYFLFQITTHLFNLLAAILINVGWSLQKLSKNDLKKSIRIFVFFLLSFIVLIGKYT